jgi:Ser/Thr protein kinase RdoA (MazF antagonist)
VISRARLGRVAYEHLAASGVLVEPPSSPRVPTVFDQAHELGTLLARTHAALDTLVLTGDDDPWPWTVSPAMLAGADDGWLERSLHGSDAERAVLVPWRERAMAQLSSVRGAPEGLCHGEIYPASCRYAADGSLAISELDWVAPGWREYDLATFLWVLTLHVRQRSEQLFADFVAGYEVVRPAPITGALRAWVAVRHLWSMRLANGFEGPAQLVRRATFASRWPLD